jgi:hypothetical protein
VAPDIAAGLHGDRGEQALVRVDPDGDQGCFRSPLMGSPATGNLTSGLITPVEPRRQRATAGAALCVNQPEGWQEASEPTDRRPRHATGCRPKRPDPHPTSQKLHQPRVTGVFPATHRPATAPGNCETRVMTIAGQRGRDDGAGINQDHPVRRPRPSATISSTRCDTSGADPSATANHTDRHCRSRPTSLSRARRASRSDAAAATCSSGTRARSSRSSSRGVLTW